MANDAGPIAVAVMGLGSIGRGIARAVLLSPDLALVGAIDAAPGVAGRSLADLVPGAPSTVRVEADAATVLRRMKGGVLLHATGSSFKAVLPQLEAAVRAGVHVVSTCEELAYPWVHYEAEADALDALASNKRVTVLGTGVNPGFVLDRLIATAGAVCGAVHHARAERVVDASKRREALQRKIGMGLTVEEFQRRVDAGGFGHVGLTESAALAALGLGLDTDEVEEELSPVIAEEPIAGPVPVAVGQVAGIAQRVRGFWEGREVVDLELTIAAGVEESYDRIHIDATPPVELKIVGGYAGDDATVWAVVNAVPRVVSADPGILTVLDLPAGR